MKLYSQKQINKRYKFLLHKFWDWLCNTSDDFSKEELTELRELYHIVDDSHWKPSFIFNKIYQIKLE